MNFENIWLDFWTNGWSSSLTLSSVCTRRLFNRQTWVLCSVLWCASIWIFFAGRRRGSWPFLVKKLFFCSFCPNCHKRWDALLIVLLPIMGPEKGTDKLAFCPTSLLIATKILSSKDQTFAWLQGQKIFFSITNWSKIVKWPWKYLE